MSSRTRMQHYPLETKLEAVRLFYEEGQTRAQITAQLGILDADRVKKWLANTAGAAQRPLPGRRRARGGGPRFAHRERQEDGDREQEGRG